MEKIFRPRHVSDVSEHVVGLYLDPEFPVPPGISVSYGPPDYGLDNKQASELEQQLQDRVRVAATREWCGRRLWLVVTNGEFFLCYRSTDQNPWVLFAGQDPAVAFPIDDPRWGQRWGLKLALPEHVRRPLEFSQEEIESAQLRLEEAAKWEESQRRAVSRHNHPS